MGRGEESRTLAQEGSPPTGEATGWPEGPVLPGGWPIGRLASLCQEKGLSAVCLLWLSGMAVACPDVGIRCGRALRLCQPFARASGVDASLL